MQDLGRHSNIKRWLPYENKKLKKKKLKLKALKKLDWKLKLKNIKKNW
jgi:hypothetical protein